MHTNLHCRRKYEIGTLCVILKCELYFNERTHVILLKRDGMRFDCGCWKYYHPATRRPRSGFVFYSGVVCGVCPPPRINELSAKESFCALFWISVCVVENACWRPQTAEILFEYRRTARQRKNAHNKIRHAHTALWDNKRQSKVAWLFSNFSLFTRLVWMYLFKIHTLSAFPLDSEDAGFYCVICLNVN